MRKDDKMVNFKKNFFKRNQEYKNKTICELKTPWNVLVCTTGTRERPTKLSQW
jgi:hypothetical protein